MPARRLERVSALLLQAVAEILMREVKDPRVSGVTLTSSSISPDLRAARIFFRTLRTEDQPAALAGLQSATGYIRREVGNRLRLRHTPMLEFCYDTALDRVNRLESLLRQVQKKDPPCQD